VVPRLVDVTHIEQPPSAAQRRDVETRDRERRRRIRLGWQGSLQFGHTDESAGISHARYWNIIGRQEGAEPGEKTQRLLTGRKHKLMAPAPCNDPQQYRKGEGGKPASECGYVEEELERCEGEREGLAFETAATSKL